MNSKHVPVATIVGVDVSDKYPPNPPPSAPYAAPASASFAAPASASFAASGSTPPTLTGMQNERGAREFLTEFHWPSPMQDAFLNDVAKVPARFFICDDSGSMQANDGKKIVDVHGTRKFIPCSRWAELTLAMRFHVGLAHAGLIPTEFRLLNVSNPLRIGFSPEESAQNVSKITRLFDDSPSGGTPLCRHITEITNEIRRLEPQLRALGQKACIIIATDGESSDGDVASALRPLKDLPVWVVVRLCTDEEKIVNYWNNIDNVLELNIDVLDDLSGEAQEVRTANPWFTYAEPMHRMREFGVTLKEIDLLDEGLLPKEQMRKICRLLYGSPVDSLPMPEVDLAGFVRGMHQLNVATPRVWSPADGKLRNWVEDSGLKSSYGGGCTIM